MGKKKLLSESLAEFAARLQWEAIPPEVQERAKLLLLDAVGVAFAASQFEFARCALKALSTFGAGDVPIIGMSASLPLRDAVLMNGILVHGIDYDDTYLPGSVHLTASCAPTALAVAAQERASGKELLAAFALGLEAGARLGAAGCGGFLRAGFHATSVVGTFAAALLAGRLMRISREQLVMAQGIALSLASGNMQPMQDGSWTKRMHPGWSGQSAITAAALARDGFVGPTEAYEGRFGLYPCFLGRHAENANLDLVTDGLGESWEFTRASIKLYPACHQSHAFMNAAIKLAAEHAMAPDSIASIRARVTEPAVPLVCEPLEAKRRPDSSYAAQFSLPYGIACCLVRGRFGLHELEESSYSDPVLLGLAQKFEYEIDPDSGFPKYRSGEVIVRTNDGREVSRRENIMPDEPVAAGEIVRKFMDNAALVMKPARAGAIRDMILGAEKAPDATELMRVLAAEREAQGRLKAVSSDS